MSVPLLATWPAMVRGESLGFVCSGDICWWKSVEGLELLENWEKLVACGGRKEIKKKEKEKKLNGKIFSWKRK